MEGASEADFVEVGRMIRVDRDAIEAEVGDFKVHRRFCRFWLAVQGGIDPDEGIFCAFVEVDAGDEEDHFSGGDDARFQVDFCPGEEADCGPVSGGGCSEFADAEA